MTRRSPPTERVIRILELFATSPGEPITFSEIARRVDITKATCHALLLTLTDAGYLIREPRTKTYTLGPALIELGNAARGSFPSVQLGHAELEQLSVDTGYPCLATAIVDDDLLIVDRVGVMGPDHSLLGGRRIPFRPPFGATAVAWAGDDAVEAWIRRSSGEVTTQQRRELLQVIEDVRRCGYAVFPLDEAGTRFRNALSDLADDVLSDDLRRMALELLTAVRYRDYLSTELTPNRRVPVDTITAPVFGANGQPDYLVCVQLVRSDTPTEEIASVGATLVRATTRMTEQSGGLLPPVARRPRGRKRTAARATA